MAFLLIGSGLFWAFRCSPSIRLKWYWARAKNPLAALTWSLVFMNHCLSFSLGPMKEGRFLKSCVLFHSGSSCREKEKGHKKDKGKAQIRRNWRLRLCFLIESFLFLCTDEKEGLKLRQNETELCFWILGGWLPRGCGKKNACFLMGQSQNVFGFNCEQKNAGLRRKRLLGGSKKQLQF